MIKTILGLVIGTGVGNVMGHLVKATMPKDVGKVAKITTIVGGSVLAGFLGKAASDYAMDEVEEIVGIFKKGKENEEE